MAGALFARCSTLALDGLGRLLREVGGQSQAPDSMDVVGELASEDLGGIPTIGGHADVARGECRRDLVNDAAGQRTPGALGPLERLGKGVFQREFEADGPTQGVARPPREREPHDGPHQVEAPQGALCLAGCPGAVAVVRSALEVTAGLFHGGIIKADVDNGAGRHQGGPEAHDPCPEGLAALGQCPA